MHGNTARRRAGPGALLGGAVLLPGMAVIAWINWMNAAPVRAQDPAGTHQTAKAPAKSQGKPQKVLTPEQVQYQQAAAQWRARRDAGEAAALQALTAERARGKVAECPGDASDRAVEDCLTGQIKTSEGNYKAFTDALRTMLGDDYPKFPGEAAASGTDGEERTAAQRVAEFDLLESESKTYRQAASAAAYNQYKGGTLAPIFSMEASQKLLRLHMEELAFIYGELVSKH